MNRYITFLLILFIYLVPRVHAQSPAAQKAAKSVFTLTTYKEDGSILAVTHGAYFTSADEGISAFRPFAGAYRASVIDAAGNKADVATIIGANETYDICRFRLNKSIGTPLPAPANTAKGTVWAVGYSTKKAELSPLTIENSEKFLDNKYDYYIIKEEINEDIEGCPIVNDGGEIIGLVQQSGTSYAIHSTDSRYYSSLGSSGLSSIDGVLKQTHIRINLPADREQARLMLLMIDASADSLNVVNTTNDYIAQYPDDVDGYSVMASYEAEHNNHARASSVMETAAKKIKNKDEAYYEYAKLIYTRLVYAAEENAESVWTLDLAQTNINKAIDINSTPAYRHLAAKIAYAKGEYDVALPIYEELTQTDIAGSEIYYEIAQTKSNLGAGDEDVFAYIDKAVEAAPKPYTAISAPYILTRAMLLDGKGEYRRALADYNVYDSLMYFRAEPDFYYMRGKCEAAARQFQQAINDLAHAAVANPQEVTYLAELAALQLRVGQFEEALKTCALSFAITADYPDIYIVRGVALHQLNRNDEALEAFRKADELGDERGAEYIAKYSLE
ncbi:MAG: hypothetical protein LUC22_00455, partial [Prevotella sp.]|nr:hypothetical protein [Prevotella sp.]